MSTYLNRCYELALKAGKSVQSNPNVGAVLVHNNRIIGEGYHQSYGGPHAEVNCIGNVSVINRPLIPDSTLYVSLEPCCHHGKTPPCTDLIIESGIRQVVIGTEDPNPVVAGGGIQKLREAGVTVVVKNDEKARALILPFTNALLKKKPFITLKFAKSKDNFIGQEDAQVWLSNKYARILAHKLRAEHDAILVGTKTALLDNPALTTRHYPGDHPTRLLIDKKLIVPPSHNIFNTEASIVVFNLKKHVQENHISYVQVAEDSVLNEIISYCHKNSLYRVLIEGGGFTLKEFYRSGYWDEAVVIHTEKSLHTGIPAPNIEGRLVRRWQLENNKVDYIRP